MTRKGYLVRIVVLNFRVMSRNGFSNRLVRLVFCFIRQHKNIKHSLADQLEHFPFLGELFENTYPLSGKTQ